MTATASPALVPFTEIRAAHQWEYERGVYRVELPPEPYLIVRAGATYGDPASRFEHPHVLAKVYEVQEFKHYRRGGSKFWTARAGVSLFFALPRTALQLVQEEGYSYIPVVISGRRFTLSVSGGTAGGGWTDWVRQSCSICCGHTVKSVRVLAQAARMLGVRLPLKPLEEHERRRFVELAARKDMLVRLAIGQKVMVAPGYNHNGRQGPFTVIEVCRRLRRLICGHDYPFRVRYSQIDWTRTAQANGVLLADPKGFNLLPAPTSQISPGG